MRCCGWVSSPMKKPRSAELPWIDWLEQLSAQRRVTHTNNRWFAVGRLDRSEEDSPRPPSKLSAPIFEDDPRISMSTDAGDEKSLPPRARTPRSDPPHTASTAEQPGASAASSRASTAIRSTNFAAKSKPVTRPSQFLSSLAALAARSIPTTAFEGPTRVGHRPPPASPGLRSSPCPPRGKSHILARRRPTATVSEMARRHDPLSGDASAWGRLWGKRNHRHPSHARSPFTPREDPRPFGLSMDRFPPPRKALCRPHAADLLPNRSPRTAPMFPQRIFRKPRALVPAPHVEMGPRRAGSPARPRHLRLVRPPCAKMITPPSAPPAPPLRPVGRWTCLRPAAPHPLSRARRPLNPARPSRRSQEMMAPPAPPPHRCRLPAKTLNARKNSPSPGPHSHRIYSPPRGSAVKIRRRPFRSPVSPANNSPSPEAHRASSATSGRKSRRAPACQSWLLRSAKLPGNPHPRTARRSNDADRKWLVG